MATTSIGSGRQADIAVQQYTDALFIRDDKKFYLGDDGDFNFRYSDGFVFLENATASAISDVDPARAGALYTFSDESSAKNLAISSGS